MRQPADVNKAANNLPDQIRFVMGRPFPQSNRIAVFHHVAKRSGTCAPIAVYFGGKVRAIRIFFHE